MEAGDHDRIDGESPYVTRRPPSHVLRPTTIASPCSRFGGLED